MVVEVYGDAPLSVFAVQQEIAQGLSSHLLPHLVVVDQFIGIAVLAGEDEEPGGLGVVAGGPERDGLATPAQIWRDHMALDLTTQDVQDFVDDDYANNLTWT